MCLKIRESDIIGFTTYTLQCKVSQANVQKHYKAHPPAPSKPEPTRVACGMCNTKSDNLKICSLCKNIAYCNREHQRQHWSAHKHDCCVNYVALRPSTNFPERFQKMEIFLNLHVNPDGTSKLAHFKLKFPYPAKNPKVRMLLKVQGRNGDLLECRATEFENGCLTCYNEKRTLHVFFHRKDHLSGVIILLIYFNLS